MKKQNQTKEIRPKRHWGDRNDAHYVKDANNLNVVMASLFPKRTDCEVFLQQEVDVTELLRFVQAKNGEGAPYKTTVFHCLVCMFARVVRMRPLLNRFIQGGRIYERNDVTVSFIAKKRFEDHSEEALMQYTAKGEHRLSDISQIIVGDVHRMREKEETSGNINKIIDRLAKMPRLLRMIVIKVTHWIDFWGKLPKGATRGDSNFTSVLISNLGSIGCPSVYHHLNNYGSTSVVVTAGAIHKVPTLKEDGSVEVRDFLDLGTTLDERIGDGFYFARSLKLIQHLCHHPEILDLPLEEEIDYEFV